MTTAQIFIPTCVYKSYIKLLGIVASWLREDGREGGDFELLLESPVTSDCSLGLLLQLRACLGYGADGKGLPGPVGDCGGAVAVLQGLNSRSSGVRIQ